MLPGDAAGELLADPQHALQVTYGCPPVFRADTAFQWPVEPKHYRRWKVCRTRDEQPISGGEYSLSRHEQLGRQRLYPSVTI
jgi:hypothetical protein